MTIASISHRASWMLVCALAAPLAALAQTPGQMEYERQQREYRLQLERQQQEQQRQQQIMNENARRQQEESRRLNQPAGGGGSAPSSLGPGAPGTMAGSERQRIEAELDRQRAEWSKRPALPAERNPLLGRWMRPASTRGNPNDPFAQLAALSKGGACELFFGGGGVFEFKPTSLVGSDAHTKPQELDQVEYRGDDKRVIVIPKSTFKIIEFHFDGPDRVTWPLYNCTLVRAGGATAVAPAGAPKAAAPAASPGAAAAPAAATAGAGGAGTIMALDVSFGATGGSARPVSTTFYVLRHSADVALKQGGFQAPAGSAVVPAWIHECQQKMPGCKPGAMGLQADAVGSIRTDPQGHALTNALAPGTYYLFGSVRDSGQERFWNVRVDLKPGNNNVKLDQRNLTN